VSFALSITKFGKPVDLSQSQKYFYKTNMGIYDETIETIFLRQYLYTLDFVILFRKVLSLATKKAVPIFRNSLYPHY
jgi:hypothetical protein